MRTERTVLDGLQVVEVGSGIAGAVAGVLLVDYGAEVVKLEPPTGDPSRAHRGELGWNRGKASLLVDPGDADAVAKARALVEGADVVLVSGPRGADPFGLDLETLGERNPAGVLLWLTPYARTVPWAGGIESHALLAARMGLATRQSSHGGGPVDLVNPAMQYVHGLLASVCAIAALVERERSGFGQWVVVDAVRAVAHAAAGVLSVDPTLPDPPTGVGPGGRHPGYTRYRTRDGRWIVSGAVGPKFERGLLTVLGLDEVFHGERLQGDLRQLIAPENLEWIRGLVAEAFASRDRDEWVAALAEAGIPAGPVDPREEWLSHPQVVENGLSARVPGPSGPVRVPGPPVELALTPGRVPVSGPDTVSPRPPRPVPAGLPPLRPGPLADLRVVEVATFVAAPYAGTVLAALGADVVKVEPVAGDPFRISAFVYNRGLRCVGLDLGSEAGGAAFRTLVASADVVAAGLRPGVERRLGIDHDSLSAVKPDVVSVSLTGFGDRGPLAGGPAVDLVLQGISGMMSAQGGDDEPVVNTSPIVDVTGSLLVALASVLGLLHRFRSGEGQRTTTSLAAAATVLQWGELVDGPGLAPAATGGRDHPGPGVFDRFYRCADGWVRIVPLAAVPTRHELLAAGLDVREGDAPVDEEELAKAVADTPADEVVAAAERAGLAAVRARPITEVIRDPELLASGHLHLRAADGGGVFVVGGDYAAFGRTHRTGPLIAPGAGEHTDEVFLALGMSEDELDQLERAGAVLRGTPMAQRLPPVYR